ncbi:RDD family protein [Aquimarina sediminis]|uniref:RDD family protein n=1 Tax=Aquimarina sediminis TaxID=2070536 RepID=UPI000CA03C8D|nr:RDD family protein [Aquimarina sediminis]
MKKKYAILPNRIKAVVVDGIIIIAAMYAVTEIFALFDNVPNIFRIIAFTFIFILYDPIMTSAYGTTVGHSFSKIAVKREDDHNKNLPFFKALIRFFIKFSLGWISLLTVTANEKRKAIHDFAVDSIVIEEA